MNDNWKVWDSMPEYGENFYDRIVGEKDEMESSKAVAKIINSYLKDGNMVLDVGCGAGHYLKSLDNISNVSFNYTGLDATENYISLANKAYNKYKFKQCRKYDFRVSDIFNLKLENNFSEITMCNNVLLHLPKIDSAISELLRVSKDILIVRTLVGNASFRIKQIRSPESYDEFGEPLDYHYYNIYSDSYIRQLAQKYNSSVEIFLDTDYNPNSIGDINYKDNNVPFDTTRIMSGMQVNNYIICPWAFCIFKKLN